MTTWKKWKYKNLTFLIISLIAAYYVSQFEQFHQFLHHIGKLNYIGAFVGGMLFVSTFTVATGAVILIFLANAMSFWELSIVAGLGAVTGDFLIFRFVKDNLASEVKLIYNQLDHKKHVSKVLHTKYFSWTLPVLGALIIASPMPDEIGVSLMGISKMSTIKFLLIAFILDAIGIFLLVYAANLIVN